MAERNAGEHGLVVKSPDLKTARSRVQTRSRRSWGKYLKTVPRVNPSHVRESG